VARVPHERLVAKAAKRKRAVAHLHLPSGPESLLVRRARKPPNANDARRSRCEVTRMYSSRTFVLAALAVPRYVMGIDHA
jgi:hypothetical protein